jgi:hypothetical protein
LGLFLFRAKVAQMLCQKFPAVSSLPVSEFKKHRDFHSFRALIGWHGQS